MDADTKFYAKPKPSAEDADTGIGANVGAGSASAKSMFSADATPISERLPFNAIASDPFYHHRFEIVRYESDATELLSESPGKEKGKEDTHNEEAEVEAEAEAEAETETETEAEVKVPGQGPLRLRVPQKLIAPTADGPVSPRPSGSGGGFYDFTCRLPRPDSEEASDLLAQLESAAAAESSNSSRAPVAAIAIGTATAIPSAAARTPPRASLNPPHQHSPRHSVGKSTATATGFTESA